MLKVNNAEVHTVDSPPESFELVFLHEILREFTAGNIGYGHETVVGLSRL